MAGEKLNFRLSPAFEFTVDKNVCENNNARVYVQNVDKCMKNYLNEHYYIPVDNHDFQMNNIMYLYNDNDEKNGEKREWINFPAKIMCHTSTESYDDYIKKINNIEHVDTKNEISEEMFYLCATDQDLKKAC
ncbi:MAG: hypothetical protein ACTJLM_00445 [Ehrlichia sp.]